MGILRTTSRGLIRPGQKPSGPVRIDAMHPLAGGLNTYIITGQRQGAEVDLVSGLEIPWTPPSGIPPTMGVTELGPSLNFDDAAANRQGITNANLLITKTSKSDGTGDFTIAGLVRVNSVTATQYQAFCGQEDYLTGNGTELYIGSDGKFRFYSNATTAIASAPVAGTFYTLVGVRAGTVQSIYVNNVITQVGTTPLTITTNGAGALIFLGGFNNFTGSQPHFDLLWCGGWNRALSADEALLLYADPYCLLMPAEGEMPAISSAITQYAAFATPQRDGAVYTQMIGY